MSSYDHPEPDYPIVPDYCDCGQHADEHDDELHNMRMDRHAPSGRLFATAAERKARRERIEGTFGMNGLGSL